LPLQASYTSVVVKHKIIHLLKPEILY